MSTLSTLRSLLERRVGEDYPIVSGTLSSMSATTTLSDTSRAESNDYFNDYYIYLSTASGTAAPYDEERRISDFYSASTITVSPGFTSSAGDSYTYEMRRVASRQDYDDAVNEAIRRARDAYLEEKVDETSIILYEDQKEYDCPSGCKYIYRLDLEQADIAASGTATSSTATTLVDSGKSWTADEFNDNYAIVITDGTGQGQQRTITDGDSTSVTVSTWTTNPDTTSDYIIKYTAQEEQRWYAISQYDYITHTASGSSTMTIHFLKSYTAGMAVRIHYAAEPAELTSDSSSTAVPDAYIENEGMAFLWEKLGSRLAMDQPANALEKASYYRAQAQEIKDKTGYRPPPTRLRQEAGPGYVVSDDYPF